MQIDIGGGKGQHIWQATSSTKGKSRDYDRVKGRGLSYKEFMSF